MPSEGKQEVLSKGVRLQTGSGPDWSAALLSEGQRSERKVQYLTGKRSICPPPEPTSYWPRNCQLVGGEMLRLRVCRMKPMKTGSDYKGVVTAAVTCCFVTHIDI